MLFAEFASIASELEKVSSRLAMTDILAKQFPSLDSDELKIFVRFMRGKLFPDWSAEKLGFGPALLYDALAYVIGRKKSMWLRR
jgi:DNA ligase N terminus.